MIGVIYMMAQDGEMPPQFARLNSHGVPRIPLIAAVAIPILILAVSRRFEALAGLYAIGVVGAISVNLGACTFNKRLGLKITGATPAATIRCGDALVISMPASITRPWSGITKPEIKLKSVVLPAFGLPVPMLPAPVFVLPVPVLLVIW